MATSVVAGEPVTVTLPPGSSSASASTTPDVSRHSSSRGQTVSSASKTLTASTSSVAFPTATADTTVGVHSSSPTNKIPIIVAVIVGVVASALVLCLIRYCVKRRKRRIREEASKVGREHWLLGHGSPEPDRALGVYGGTQDVERHVDPRHFAFDTPYSYTQQKHLGL